MAGSRLSSTFHTLGTVSKRSLRDNPPSMENQRRRDTAHDEGHPRRWADYFLSPSLLAPRRQEDGCGR